MRYNSGYALNVTSCLLLNLGWGCIDLPCTPQQRTLTVLLRRQRLKVDLKGLLREQQRPSCSREAIDKYFARRLHQSVDDRGLKESRLVPAAASWIGNGATSLPGRMYISIMLRSCKYRHFYFIFLLFGSL